MSIRIGDFAPDFAANSTKGVIRFHEWMAGGWAVLFSHPKDFTPVCTTELVALAKLEGEFARRQVKIVALSVDEIENHERWVRDVEARQGIRLNFPLIADADRRVSMLYDMIHPNARENVTVRAVFVIDSERRVRLILTYPNTTGRNFPEILRAIDSLQLTSRHELSTPADWRPGEDVLIPTVLNSEEAKRRYPDGWREESPYLRYVPDPVPPRPAD